MTAILNQALALHQQGDFDAAERLYRQLLAHDPQSVQVLNFYGMLLHQTSRAAESCTLLERAVALAPAHAPAWNNLALAQRQLQQFDAALHSTAQALATQADYVPAWLNHANTLRSLGRPREAIAACQRALALQAHSAHAQSAQAHNTQGAAHHDLGEHAQALRCHDAAIALSPRLASAHFNRGVVLGDLQRPQEACASYTTALQLDPDNAVAWNNLGFVLDSLLRHEDARAHYAQALALDPDYALAHLNLGTVLDELGRGTEALVSFDQALRLSLPGAARPNADTSCAAHMGKGLCHMGLGQFDAAASCFAAVAALAPAHPYVQGHWFDACARAANWAALDAPRAAIVAGLTDAASASAAPVAMPFNALAAFDSPALQLACAQGYATQACPVAPALWQGQRYTHPRPRIAYLSADFHDHATAQLMVEVFEQHTRAQFEVFALSFGPRRQDAMRQRLQVAFEHFVDVADAPDADIAQWLRTNEIDIAVDLKGYTHQSRPGIFAYRPCPVQVNYLGYPGTMGSRHWDYILGDEQVTPTGCEAFFTEKIVRFRHSYQANCAIDTTANNDATTAVSTRQQVGLPPTGFVFACFNEVYKITREVFAVWMRLLMQVPESVLWLLTDAPTVQAQLRAHASRHGIDPARLCFAHRLPHAAHLARLGRADLFLDTLPVNAHTTASDALRAGLPVLTCAGQSFASRVASSLLHAVGLPELVTHNLADYEALALRLATHPDDCTALRDKLARQRATAPLFDPVAYTRGLESAFQHMVDRSRAGAAPEGFTVG